MSLSERILATAASLSESKQLETLASAEYLKSKTGTEDSRRWNNFSVATAMKNMENEESHYSLADLKEIF